MVIKLCKKSMLILLIFLIGRPVYGQELKCELFKLLHHSDKGKITYFDNGIARVFLENSRAFELEFLDSSVHFFSKTEEVKIQPVDASAYSIKVKEGNLLVMDAKDTINLNKGLDTLSNIETSEEFSSSWKIGKSSFLDVTYTGGKADKVEVLELQRKISLWISYVDNKPEIKKVKVTWLDSGNYLTMAYSGNNPYLLVYYDASKKGGIAVFFKFKKDYVSDALVYLSTKGAHINEINEPDYSFTAKGPNKVFSVKYDKNGIVKKASRKKFGCDL